jgi:hypothetical protein
MMPTPKKDQTPAYWKKRYQQQKARGEVADFLERQKARRLADKEGMDREGKHVDHIKPIKEGGKTTKSNIRVVSAKTNYKAAPPRGKEKWKGK